MSLTRFSQYSDPRFILRVASFLSILFGTLSFLTSLFPNLWPPGTGVPHLVSAEEALGFTFLGFAVRLLRLEMYKPWIRVVVRTSRICLVILGLLGMQGVGLLSKALPRFATAPPEPHFAASFLFLLLGLRLCISGRLVRKATGTALVGISCAYMACCWTALFLSAGGLRQPPWLFEIRVPSILLLSLVCIGLTLSSRMNGVFDVLLVKGPAATAARQTFPIVILLPVILAVVRHQAETAGLLQPQTGLLLHVLLSIGVMALLFAWQTRRLVSEHRDRQRIEGLSQAKQTQRRAILAQLAEPVWVFDGEGRIQFSNSAASGFLLPGKAGRDPISMADILGRAQLRSVLTTVIFGDAVSEITLHNLATGEKETRAVRFLSVENPPQFSEISVLLIAGHSAGPEGANAAQDNQAGNGAARIPLAAYATSGPVLGDAFPLPAGTQLPH